MCKTIAIVNQKGGVAKTTTTNALGIGLAIKGYKVLLVDLDPQGSLSMSLGIPFPDEQDNTLPLLFLSHLQGHSNADISDYINSVYGVDFLISNSNLEPIERMLTGFRDGEYVLDTILQPLKQMYDYIIIDCMSSIGNLTENAIVTSDEIIVPSEPQYFSTKGIQLFFDEIGKIQRRKNPKLTIRGILPTKVDTRTNISRFYMKAVREIFEHDVHIFGAIPSNTKLSECNDGKNIYEYDKDGKGVLAYAAFVEEYLNG